MRTALLYVRISQDREGAGLGVARQLKDCEALCERLGWKVAGVYTDNDVSASTGKRRPEYERLLADLASARGTAIVAWHPDRLHRSPRELETFIDVVEKAKATVATVRAGDLDLSTPSGRAVARTLGAWARYEVEAKSDRTRSKMDELARAGAFQGGARPFGYEADGIAVRPDEAAEVAKMTADVLAGRPFRQIARDLNERGVLTSAGKPWGGVQVRQLVLRARNAGLRQHRGEVIGAAVWPAIVKEADWRAVKQLIESGAKPDTWVNTHRYLGSGLFRCGICGDKVRIAVTSTRKGSQRTIYRCASTMAVTTRAPGAHVARHIDPVDALVIELVIARLSRQDATDLLVPVDDSALEVVNEVAQLRERMNALAVEFADGVLTVEQIKTMTARMRERIELLERRLPARPTPPALAALAAAADVRAKWSELTIDERRSVVDLLVDVRLLPAKGQGKRFNPDLVDISWKSA
jgi:site-specific DNA recombinase